MEWRALEEHFRAATTREPGPFGEDAIEWDYSRYARWIGVTGAPGVHELPHRGCAVLALPSARWDPAAEKIGSWAEQRGWTLWRCNARPTVAAPDPVVCALGVRATGENSMLFARTSLARTPAPRRRPRSAGMSFPLAPGERWLIATDRVRRRMRAQIAERGVVVLVEEAEWMTPAALALLVYLLDAHRHWRARTLARPARVYVVLATEREEFVLRMLEQFGLLGHLPVLRERRAAGTVVTPALLDAEEEHLFAALAAAPFALAEEDVRAIFGASAIDRCRTLVERGLLRRREELGVACFVAAPAMPAALPPASPRALKAIAECYRHRARRGQENLVLAAASLDSRRAAATVGRMPVTAGATLPATLFEGLDATLDRARGTLHADQLAGWFSLAAHGRAGDRAREVAAALTERGLRTWRELHRVVRLVLCAGRGHMMAFLPQDFWPRLRSDHIAGPFMDATCVLAELFWRKSSLSDADIRQRYEFASECFAKVARPADAEFARLERLSRALAHRAAVQLGIPSNVLSTTGSPSDPPAPGALRAVLRSGRVPAYITATLIGADATTWLPLPTRSFDRSDVFLATSFTATTGNPSDLVIPMAMVALDVTDSRLLLRDLFDEVLLLGARRPIPRPLLGRIVARVAGARMRLPTANALFFENGRSDLASRDASDESGFTGAFMAVGDFESARVRVTRGLALKPTCPFLLSRLIRQHIKFCRQTLDASLLAATADLVEQHAATLTPGLLEHLLEYARGSQALCSGRLDVATGHFWKSHGVLQGTFAWAQEAKLDAARAAGACIYLQRVAALWRGGGRYDVWKALRAVCRNRYPEEPQPSLRMAVATHLDFGWQLLESWAAVSDDLDEALRITFFLRPQVDASFAPLGRDFVQLAAKWAPSFYERLRAAVIQRAGNLDFVTPEGRALGSALRTIEDAWKGGHGSRDEERWVRTTARADRSRARQAVAALDSWCDDATAYAYLWELLQDGARDRDAAVVAYGHVGHATKPVATVLRFRLAQRGDHACEAVVEAGGPPPSRDRRRWSREAEGAHEAFLGESTAARDVRTMIGKAARCSYPVLILGETGVGKDLVARCIHRASARHGRPMVVAECASTAESLLESELFGHEKGAFTGAHASHSGYFERANGSSLLLDEVDSMPARMQAALLRVLETGEYRPVGASTPRRSEFRLISAALPRLAAMVEERQFRQDLFYRISTLRLEVPPLREREGDAREIAIAHARTLGLQLTPGALRAISNYDWPGNVRQLRHCIQAASLHAGGGKIGETAVGDAIGSYGRSRQSDVEEGGGLEASWTRALRTLERLGRFGAWEFAQAAEVSRRSAQRHIAELLRDGRIVRAGAGRTTKYVIRR